MIRTLLFSIILFFYSCQQGVNKIYDVNGKLIEIRKLKDGDTSVYKHTLYHPNGNIKAEGYIFGGLRQSFWKEYYPDSTLRWEGRYEDGLRMYPMDKSVLLNSDIAEYEDRQYDRPVIWFSKQKAEVGDTIGVRIKKIHPDDIADYACIGNVKIERQKDNYDYHIITKDTGYIYMQILTCNIKSDKQYFPYRKVLLHPPVIDSIYIGE